jgi:hypothetical protein
MRSKLTLAKETLRALDEQELSWVVGGGGNEHEKKKHKNGSNGSGKGPSGDGPPGCNKKKHNSNH